MTSPERSLEWGAAWEFSRKNSSSAPVPRSLLPAIWGGIECTVNRVGDRYFDQIVRTGHQGRRGDLERFAELGIQALRYPVLWERTAPGGVEHADWRWPDDRLSELRRLGVRPIVGLVHHGSGPPTTDLLDPDFPPRLAAYARAVAERYPWVEDWTPVNEPLSTARFSALYGYWYPHLRDDHAFARALLNQCRAVVLAMQAIRTVNPASRLIQTDDLGKTFATPNLAYQAEWENERRWLTWDLLTGTLTPDHPLWTWLRYVGIGESELAWFLENPCQLDIVGINHYLSSVRFLDDRLELYPEEKPGTNGRHRYADVLAARLLPEGIPGPGAFLQEAWDRYHLPLAVTEVHNGCTREEQLRWIADVWTGALEARAAGVDVQAVTAWSLLGAFDWDHMVTEDRGHYEPGVFDLRAPAPRPTAVARMLRDLARDGHHDHPVLAGSGWWQQPDRLLHGAAAGGAPAQRRTNEFLCDDAPPRPILIVGGEDALTDTIVVACQQRYLAYAVVHGAKVSHGKPREVEGVFYALKPWAVIDLRSPSSGCEAKMAAMCAAGRVAYLGLSTTRQESPALADASPLLHVLSANPGALIVGADPKTSVAVQESEGPSPSHVTASGLTRDDVHAALDLLIDGETGFWQLPHAWPAETLGLPRARG